MTSPFEGGPAQNGGRRVSLVPLGVHGEGEQPGNDVQGVDNHSRDEEDSFAKYSLSSYRHPHDIPPPTYAYSGNYPYRATEVSPHDTGIAEKSGSNDEHRNRRHGILTGIMDWYSGGHDNQMMNGASESSDEFRDYHGKTSRMRRDDSAYSECSMGSDMLEPDDPRMTGKSSKQLDDQGDLEKNTLRLMDYKTRRKHIQRIRIQFNISCKC